MEKRLILRLLLVPVVLYFLYTLDFPIEVIAIFGVFYVALIFLRGKIWKASEKAIEKYLPFTKTWPGIAQKILVIIFFIIIYLILKQVIFFLLGLIGIDLEGMIMSSYMDSLDNQNK